MATYSPLSFGSLPGTIPTTLRAGEATGTTSNRTATAAVVPVAPGVSCSSGVVNIFAAVAAVIRNAGARAAGPAGLSSSTVRGRRRQGGSRERERGRRVERAGPERDRLEVRAVVSRRHQARPLDLGRDVGGALHVAGRPRLAPLHRIVGEDVEPSHQVARCDRRSRRAWAVCAGQLDLGGGGRRRKQREEEGEMASHGSLSDVGDGGRCGGP